MRKSDLRLLDMNALLDLYDSTREEIRKRVDEFRGNMGSSEERIFAELCFCICTPQSRATVCWKAISTLMENGLLYRGLEVEIAPFLIGVRFNKRKAACIVEARRFFTKGGILWLKERLKASTDIFELREWLVRNVKGLGMKEASHFLRNVGLGLDLAILDRHVLKSLKRLGIVTELPVSLTKRKYEKMENMMKSFAQKIGIPMAELDLLLWSSETDMIFK